MLHPFFENNESEIDNMMKSVSEHVHSKVKFGLQVASDHSKKTLSEILAFSAKAISNSIPQTPTTPDK